MKTMKNTARTKRASLLAIPVLILLAASACVLPFVQQQQPPPPLHANPGSFISTLTGDDGMRIELRGQSSGFKPGDQTTYLLDVYNGTFQKWETNFCMLLVDEAGIISTLQEDSLSLNPQESTTRVLEVAYPADLSETSYGLMLIFPDRFSTHQTVSFGGSDRHSAGPWPMVSCP
jgi:hypothetical protein